jgi:rRNA maturation protein Rpf1
LFSSKGSIPTLACEGGLKFIGRRKVVYKEKFTENQEQLGDRFQEKKWNII